MERTKTDRQWEKWGKQNPYFGVLGWESRDCVDDEVRRQFFETGRVHIEESLATAETIFGKLEKKNRAVDFGCGVGRLLPLLAERFTSVVGVDISAQMRVQCQKNTTSYSNIQLCEFAEDVPDQIDFLHSYIVLQHIRPEQGMKIIDTLVSKVAKDGMFSLHFTAGDSKLWRTCLNWLRYRIAPLHFLYNIVRRRPIREPVTEMNCYDVHSVISMLGSRGFHGVYVSSSEHNGHKGVTLFGRRSDVG